MSNNSWFRSASTVVAGAIFGALGGAVLATILGFGLLLLLFELQPPTGDVTGMGGLIILCLPFGVVAGAMRGIKLAQEHLASLRSK